MRREENEAETEELLFFLKLSKFRRWKIGAAEVDGVMRAEFGEEGRGGAVCSYARPPSEPLKPALIIVRLWQ